MEYFPKITSVLNKKLKDSDTSLHTLIAQAYGALIEHGLK